MSETVGLILSLSLSGSIIAGLMFAIKPLIKHKISKTIQYYLWIVVILRLVIPFSFEESIMNSMFNGQQISSVIVSSQVETSSSNATVTVIPDAQENASNGKYNNDVDHSRYFGDLFNQYVFYIWMLGVIIALAVNLVGYARFLIYLKQASKPAFDEENRMLETLMNGRKNVKLLRNSLATTPMLIGILRPCIIIPDINYHEKQLKNILLHEITHLRRLDIAAKWLTMIAASIHWFNPLMYFIKREINHACELSCDETVIRKFNSVEKQAYGDTLISVVSKNKYPVGVLQATMSEEKETIKERLVSIMKYHKKSKSVIFMSIMLLFGVISASVLIGACSGKTDQEISYKNDKYGFSMNLPKDFADNAEIKDEGNVIYFVNKEIQEANPGNIFGVVGRIEIYDKAETSKENMEEKEDAYSLRYLGENDYYYFGWAHATDVQIPPGASDELKENYRAMENKFNEIIKTFMISKGFNKQVSSDQILSFIHDFDEKKRSLSIDEIEWVNQTDTNRINELGLDAQEDFPNGYYIYNESEEKKTLKLSDDAKIYIVNWNGLKDKPLLTDFDGLAKRIDEYEAPYHLTIKDGVIVEILEQYRP